MAHVNANSTDMTLWWVQTWTFAYRITCCAAEEGSPDEVWEAIKLLKCARLDHGVRAMEDPACIAFLEETQVPLTVCPRSNYMVRATTAVQMAACQPAMQPTNRRTPLLRPSAC